jgi:transcriptional regulator with XRE-family HTH domain
VDIRQIVGDNIRCFRYKVKWTQEKLGEVAGLSGDYIGRLERGLENISVENLVKLSNALNIEPSYFLIEDYCHNNQKNTKDKT